MSEYKLLVAWKVIEFLEVQPLRDQKRLRDRFVAIAEWPAQYSDFKEADASARHLDVHIYGRYAIRFWEDFANRHLKILDVCFADS